MAKKDFKQNNPALAFISTPEEETQHTDLITDTTDTGKIDPPEGYRVNPLYIEKKTRRVNLILQPSVADGLKEVAKAKGISANEAASEAIRSYIKEHKGE